MRRFCIILPIVSLFLHGCLTPEKAVIEADREGNAIVAQFTEKVTGKKSPFSIDRPSDRLRNRLLLEQSLDPSFAKELGISLSNAPPLPDPLVVSLADAMKIAAANDDKFQLQKESVFQEALKLSSTRREFETTFAGVLGLGHSGSSPSEGVSSGSASGNFKPSLSRKLKNGLTFASSIGLDIVKLLTGERTTALGITGDASLSVPLLKGAGRAIATEQLTQAERNMLYAIYSFESYRQKYAVSVAENYYKMLERVQNQIATRDNISRLDDNYRKSKLLYEAGRLSQVELDQTRQDLLSNQDSLKSSEVALRSALDTFKKTIGLPVDSRVELDYSELEKAKAEMMSRVTETNSFGQPVQPPLPWSEEEAIEIAFTNRIEVILARHRLEDARRQFKLAADNLNPELALSFSLSHGENKKTGEDFLGNTGYGANLRFNPLWDRTAKRNAYRMAVLSLEQAERTWTELEESTRQLVRDDFRAIDSAWSSYVIQSESLVVAERRVRSTSIFQQAGKSSTRDILEAQAALLKARNSVAGALVNYRMAGLKLRADLSLLKISEDGLLLED